MANTKLATACAAVLLAAGLTLGVGWVAARPGAGDASAVATPAQQPKKEPDPKAGKEDKAAKLRKQGAEIARRIEDVQARLTRQAADQENTVDLPALQSELYEIDKDILIQENQAKIQDRVLAESLKEQEAGPKRPLDKRDLDQMVDHTAEVKEALRRVEKAKQALDKTRPFFEPNSPTLKAAENAVAEATAALKTAREKVRPQVERERRAELERYNDHQVEQAKRQIDAVAERLAHLRAKRKELVTRIAQARQRDAKRQVLEDELRVLRGIQMELLRQQTLAELGIEGMAVAPMRAEVDPVVEVQINELRREVEVLRAEVQKLKK